MSVRLKKKMQSDDPNDPKEKLKPKISALPFTWGYVRELDPYTSKMEPSRKA